MSRTSPAPRKNCFRKSVSEPVNENQWRHSAGSLTFTSFSVKPNSKKVVGAIDLSFVTFEGTRFTFVKILTGYLTYAGIALCLTSQAQRDSPDTGSR
jgi:hypothetical protein